MNAESTIRELVEAHLSDNHNVYPVEFIDQLLQLAYEVGEIHCTLVENRKLRFQMPGQPAWDVELGRAKAKLRILCARLGVLCNENQDQDVNIFGGEGLIRKELSVKLPDNLGRSSGSDLSASTSTSLVALPISKE